MPKSCNYREKNALELDFSGIKLPYLAREKYYSKNLDNDKGKIG